MRNTAIVLMTLLVGTGVASAQVQIDKRRPASPKSEVHVDSAFGSLEIVGWDEEAVAVTGTLAAGAEGLDFDSEDGEVYISVEEPESWLYESDDDAEYRSSLVVQVPRGSSVRIDTTNATVKITGIVGNVGVDTINGAVVVRGDPRSVEVDTVTGAVDVQARSAEMDVETVSGAVVLAGVHGGVDVTTVTGGIDVSGDGLSEVRIETTSGNVRVDASFVESGDVDIETFSGKVELVVPGDVKARFECVTFAGEIQNAIGPTARHRGRFTPYKELKFSTALNDFDVSVETYNGDIAIQTRGQ